MMKKLLSIILAVLMISAVPAIAETESKASEEQLNLLTALKIAENYHIDGSAEVSRGEAAQLAARLIGLEESGFGQKSDFADVGEDNPYSGYISALLQIGAVSPAENYRPNDTVQFNELVKMLVGALKYSGYADSQGGWPTGYYSTAKEIGLLKNIDTPHSGTVTYSVAVKMLYNALFTKTVDVSIENGYAQYDIDRKSLFLNKVYDTYRKTGIVTATERTKHIEGTNFSGRVEIDGAAYVLETVNGTDIDSLIGKRVYFYVRDIESDIPEIIATGELAGKNKTLVIGAEYIRKPTALTTLSYSDNEGKIRRESVKQGAVFFYNGKKETVAPENIPTSDGRLTLIDNDGDEVYDYVFIESYTKFVVQGSAFGKISSKYDDTLIDVAGNENILLYRNGIEITSDYVGEWNTVKTMLSLDGLSGILDVSYDEIDGTVTNSIIEDDEEFAEIDGKRYKVSELYRQACNDRNYYAVSLSKGITGTFVLDGDGEIVGIKAVTAGKKVYGFAIRANGQSGLEDKLQIKLYEMYGKMTVRDVAEKVKVNGKPEKTYDKIIAPLLDSSGNFKSQLLLYKINEAGEITEFETAVDASLGNGVEGGYDGDRFSLDEHITWDGSGTRSNWTYYAWSDSKIRLSTSCEGNRISAVEETPCFYIPYDRADDAKYAYMPAYNNMYKFSTDTDIQVFDTVKYDEDYNFKKLSAIVLYERQGGENPENPYSSMGANDTSRYVVVKDVGRRINDSGEEEMYFEGTMHSDTAELGILENTFAETVYNIDASGQYGFGGVRAEDLEEGDIVKLGYENPFAPRLVINRFICYGDADFYSNPANSRVYSLDRASSGVPDWADVGGCTIIGDVIYSSESECIIKTKDHTGASVYYGCYPTYNTRVCIYNTEKEKMTEGSREQLKKGQHVLVLANNKMQAELLVIVDNGGDLK